MRRLAAVTAFVLFGALAQAQSTTVTVRDRAGAPVGNAHVEILAGPAVTATATTDDKGTATFAPSPGSYRARANGPGFVVGLSETFKQEAGARGAVRINLFPGSALAGTVVDADDRPLSGAELCLSLHDWGNYPPAAFGEELLERGKQCWDTDERGQLVTPVLPLGSYDLSIELEGLVPRKTTLKLERDYASQVWRLRRGGSIKGVVQDKEDKPVAMASVRVRHRELEAERETATDAEGRFEAGGLAAGPWSVRVEPPNAAVILRDGITVKEDTAADLGVLRVRSGLALEGVVVDSDGEPVAGTEIQVRLTGRVGRAIRKVQGNDEGRFVAAGLGEEAVNLLVDAPPGHASVVIEDVEPPRRDLEIELPETGSVCGVVLTEEGSVAAGTGVTALPEELGLLERYPEHVVARTREVDPESGRFCLEDVHPDRGVSVSARAAGYRKATARIDVAPGREAGPVELTLQRGLSLEGIVVDTDGQPVRDAAVRARGTAMVYSDGFGEFRLSGLASGMNQVLAEHPDYAVARREVLLPLGEGEIFRIELGAGGTIEGTVKRSGGEPVEGVPVALDEPSREQLTDVEGRFRFDTVPTGERFVTRKARGSYDDFERRGVDVVEDETARVDFTLGVVLEGMVLRGGVPVPGVSIALAQPHDVSEYTDNNHAVQRTFSDESGAYRLSGVRPGWGTVTLEQGKQTVMRQIDVPPGDLPRRDLRLPDRPIRGIVVSAGDGTGIGQAMVSVTLAATAGAPHTDGSSSYSSSDEHGGISYNLTSSPTSRTTTDAAGNFVAFADPLPETRVAAWTDGYRWTEVTADPESGEALRIELPRETALIVKLRDAQGNGARNAKVCAELKSDDGNRSTNCTMGGSDEVRFSLNEGTYEIRASAAGFGTKVVERELKVREDGTAHEITVTLVPGAPLDIRLVGQPSEAAKVVSLIDPTGAERTGLVDDEGVDAATGDRHWTTWGLDPGVWAVTVDDGSGKVIVREVEVAAGPPVEVVLP